MFWRLSISEDMRSRLGSWAVSLACALVVFSCVLISIAPAKAYDDDHQVQDRLIRDEAVLGTFHLRGTDQVRDHRDSDRDDVSVVPKRSRQHGGEGVAVLSTYSTADLLHMFADARAASEAGDSTAAQRLFERVIAARPNSELADAARKDLATLYRGPNDRADQTRKHMPSVRPLERSSPRPSRRVYGPTLPRENHASKRRPIVKQRSRRLVMLERQFIADVGDRIFFAKGRDQLGARARAVLEAQADWLKAHPDIVVTVEGHAADDVAVKSETHNLSLARAEVVRQLLVSEGVAKSRIVSLGRGSAHPIAMCSMASCSAQNRRVVTVISSEPIRIVGDSVGRFGDRAPSARTRISPPGRSTP